MILSSIRPYDHMLLVSRGPDPEARRGTRWRPVSSIPETGGQETAGPAPDAPEPSRGFRAMFGSLRIRNYRLFCIGQLSSNTVQWTQRVAQDWLVLSIT